MEEFRLAPTSAARNRFFAACSTCDYFLCFEHFVSSSSCESHDMLCALFAKDAEVGACTNLSETFEDLFPGVGERFDNISSIPLPRENADE